MTTTEQEKTQNPNRSASARKFPHDHLRITAVGDRIVIDDFSREDDRVAILALLGRLGIGIEVETESRCG